MMGFGLFGGLFMFLFWGGLIALAIWAVSAFLKLGNRNFPSQPLHRSPREILDERYARGEIAKDQYEEAKKDLAN